MSQPEWQFLLHGPVPFPPWSDCFSSLFPSRKVGWFRKGRTLLALLCFVFLLPAE